MPCLPLCIDLESCRTSCMHYKRSKARNGAIQVFLTTGIKTLG